MKRSALYLLLLLIFFGVALSTVQSYFQIKEKEDQLDRLRSQVNALQDKLTEKKEDLAYRRSPEFIYKEALEQLGLTRPGEVIPVLPDWEDKKIEVEAEPAVSSATAATEPLPYWKQWRALFFVN
uniref:Septum formation initiator family protein n=1 Tax=candidate division WWE3 bacterium TaxID=2053526 RepID=A0A831YSM8_UNCKA